MLSCRLALSRAALLRGFQHRGWAGNGPSPDGGWIGADARPQAVKNFLAYTLVRLGVDHVDIDRPARLDPNVPIEGTVGAIADLVKAGCPAHRPLRSRSRHNPPRAVHPIADLQIEYSLLSRGPEAKIFPLLAELGIGITACGVLSRGLLRRLQAGGCERLPWLPSALQRG